MEERKQVTARLPKSFIANLSKTAIDQEVSLNDIIEDLLIEWYNKQPQSNQYGKANYKAKAPSIATTASPVASKVGQSSPKEAEKAATQAAKATTVQEAAAAPPFVKRPKKGAKSGA